MLIRTAGAGLCALLLAAIGASGAQARTKVVYAGPPVAKRPASMPKDADVNAFYRHLITIHVGDKVRWKLKGFHTVTFPKKGSAPPPFEIADPEHPLSRVDDAAGRPFWFNGQPRVIVNPVAGFRQGGRAYNGRRLTGSGAPPEEGKRPDYVLRFTRRGTFDYWCAIHPGMHARVRVVARGRSIPSARADRRAARREFARDLRTISERASYRPPANTVQGGNDTRRIVLLRFFPDTLRISVGDSVTFRMSRSPAPIHTFSFGPADYRTDQANALITPLPNDSGPPTLLFNPIVAYPSDPPRAGDPPSLPPYNGTEHGNGFYSTGVLDARASPPPHAMQIRFTRAGTYEFQCLVHPEMQGKVIVG